MKVATSDGQRAHSVEGVEVAGDDRRRDDAPVVGAERLAGLGRRGSLRRIHEHDPLGRRDAERLEGSHIHQGALADPRGQERLVEHGDAGDGERLLALAAIPRGDLHHVPSLGPELSSGDGTEGDLAGAVRKPARPHLRLDRAFERLGGDQGSLGVLVAMVEGAPAPAVHRGGGADGGVVRQPLDEALVEDGVVRVADRQRPAPAVALRLAHRGGGAGGEREARHHREARQPRP